MLILTRRPGESVMIGEDIVIMVLGVKGNHVRIGVTAPKHVAVHRQEIYERIQEEKRSGQQPRGNLPGDSERGDDDDLAAQVG